jgi:hypothetical protein
MVDASRQVGKGRTLARVWQGIVFLSLLHCNRGATQPTPATRAPKPPAAPSAEARRETPKPAESAQTPAKAATEPALAAKSADERFALARARLPELDKLSKTRAKLDFSRFGAEGATVALHVPESLLSHGVNTMRLCRRVVFEIHSDRLTAEVPIDGGEGRPKLKAPASFDWLELGRYAATYGTNHRGVEQNAKGERVETMQTISGASHHGGELLEIRDEAIAYGAVPVAVKAICTAVEERPCVGQGGQAGACRRCMKLGAAFVSRNPQFGFGSARPSTAVRYGDRPLDCGTCPADALAQEIPRINQALAGMTFYTTATEPWPVISRRREPCEAAERAHRP